MTSEIQDVYENAITVEELIEELSMLNPNAKVFMKVGYGDVGDTPQALPVSNIDSDLTTADMYESGYSRSRVAFVVDDGEPRDDDYEEGEDVVVLEF